VHPGPRGFDLLGALLSAAAIAALIGALNLIPARGPSPQVLGLAGAALLLGAGFVVRERGTAAPMVDLALFRDGLFALGTLAAVLSFMAYFSTTLLMPFYLAQVRGLSPREMGLCLTAVPLALLVFSPISGWLSDRVGSRGLCVAGMAALTVALATLATAGTHDPLWTVILRLALCGVGLGLFQPPNNSAVMGSLPRARLGSGAGLFATARNVGMALGIALAGSLFSLRAGTSLPAFSVAAVVAVLAAVVSASRRRDRALAPV
jgi:MFS family permease